MKKSSYIILIIIFVVFGIFFVTEIWASLLHHFNNLTKWFGNHKRTYYPWYLWLAAGAIVFPLMNRFLKKNIDIIKIYTHEMSHALVAMITFRRITSFQVTERDGVVYSSGSEKTRFLVSLAPYCFLHFTFPLMMLRCLVQIPMLPIIDVLIGITIGLHVTCFKEQTSRKQPDINRHPLAFSFVYIITILLFNLCLILLSYEPSLNIFYAFKTMGVDLWNIVASLWR